MGAPRVGNRLLTSRAFWATRVDMMFVREVLSAYVTTWGAKTITRNSPN